MKFYSVLLGVFMITTLVTGQESSQYSLYMNHKYALNPAYAGLESTLSITTGFRSQWQELPGSPTSKIVHAHMPLYYLKGAGGIKIEQESFGIENNVRVSASYNYVYESPIGLFSAGLGLGFIHKSLDGSLLRTPQGKYEGGILFHQDDILFENTLSGLTPQIIAGLYFAQDKLEIGLAVENIHSPTIRYNHGKTSYHIGPRINLNGEYKIELAELILLTPSVLLKSDFQNVQLDLSAMAEINNKVFAGLGLRGYSGTTFDAISVFGGLKINENIKIFYGLDFTISSLNTAHQGTHELVLNYNLNKKIGAIEREPILFNPRY